MVEDRKRHGCLTAWLIFMIVINSVIAGVYLFASDAISKNLPNAPAWSFPVFAVACIFNVVCAVALFKWKKWGFFGFLATSVFAIIVNLMIGLGIAQSLLGIIGVAILYGVLQIGKEKNAWHNLE